MSPAVGALGRAVRVALALMLLGGAALVLSGCVVVPERGWAPGHYGLGGRWVPGHAW